MGDPKRIALINAVTGSIGPAKAALAGAIADADVWTILDDRLLQDADARGGLTDELRERMRRLIRHAASEGADGVLLTCSLYGPVADGLQTDGLPVLSADAAAFDAVAEHAGGVVAVASGQQVPLDDSIERLQAYLQARGVSVRLVPLLTPGAAEAAASGDYTPLAARITDAVTASDDPIDAVLLAQYSLAPAAELVAERLGSPVITGPGRAAARLAQLLHTEGQGA